MIVRQIPVGTMANFVYVLMDMPTKEALVVDSGWETDPIVKACESMGANVKSVVATHEHFDHTSTLRELAGRLGARVLAHEDSPVDSDAVVVGGQELRLGRSRVKVLHTPGHTQDSICIYDGKEVFTGDTLFVGAIGRFDEGSALQIFNSLHDVLMRLPDETVIYSGHDYGEVPFRSLREEKAANPYLQPRDFRSFQTLFS